jgi:hypothetical protein
MASPEDIYSVVFYPEEEQFVLIRNNGTVSRPYGFDAENELFVRVYDWAESGAIEYEVVR